MSLNSFDDIFKPLTEEKKDSRADPFVFAGPSKPKIVPVTPLGWRRNPGGRIPEKTSSMLGQLINEIENESLDQVQDS